MSLRIQELDPARRKPLRFLVNDSVVVGFTNHALDRCIERGLRPTDWTRQRFISSESDLASSGSLHWKRWTIRKGIDCNG